MSKSAYEIFIELELTLLRLTGLTGFSHSSIINVLELEDDYASFEEREALANIIHAETVLAKRLLSDYWTAKNAELETAKATGNKKPA